MRRLVALALVWAFASTLIGLLGSFQIERLWKARVEAELRRISESVRMIVEARQFDLPANDDPQWKEMEQQLDVSVLPTDIPPRFEAEANMTWDRAPDGGYRVTTTIGCRQNPTAIQALTVLRIPPAAGERTVWWQAWILVSLVGMCFAVAVLWQLHLSTTANQRLMDPWVASVQRGPENTDPLLDPIDISDGQLSTSMAMIAEAVNHIYFDLKNWHERSELVFGNLREGVLAVDDGARVLLANRSLQRLLNLSDEPYLYRPLLEAIRAPVICNLVDSVLKDASPRDVQVEFGSQPSYLHILARPLPLGQARHGALLTVRDETLIKRVELIRRDFVANASHELKTPLAAIRAYAETLQLGALKDPTAAANFVGNIVAQADRLNMLVQSMLQLSRAEVGGALSFQQFDACTALEPCLTAAQAVAQAKAVDVNVNFAEKTLSLESDRDAFQTIASNLLSNAVSYTQVGGSVWVKLFAEDSQLVLEVRDTGIGMQQSDLERAFERFYRAQKDRSSETGGTGLGLSMVKHLTQALGGSVWATSEPNKGSTFVVRLPIRRLAE